MKIAVLLKQVPDSQSVRLDAETGTLLRDPADAVTNPLDLCALGAAARLTEEVPRATVTALTMGPTAAQRTLRQALALGAARGILICDPACAGSDTYVTARILAAALEKFGPFDLILTGLRASDGETGQVGPEIAARLGLPVVTGAEALTRVDEGLFEVLRSSEMSHETIRFRLPALVSTAKGIGQANLPTLERKTWARREPLTILSATELGLAPDAVGLNASPTRVVKVLHPKVARRGKILAVSDTASLDRATEAFLSVVRGGSAK